MNGELYRKNSFCQVDLRCFGIKKSNLFVNFNTCKLLNMNNIQQFVCKKLQMIEAYTKVEFV